MPSLSKVSETLYVPLIGRIYASKNYPEILFDEKALVLENALPDGIKHMPGQNDYTYMASAVRSVNMDECVKEFLSDHPQGTIINAGCGLETTCHRNDNAKALWFELDLPEVLELRSTFFPESERDRYLPYSMFDPEWIKVVQEASDEPVMVIASGLFYYVTMQQVIEFITLLFAFPAVELVFDAVSSLGMKGTQHYMKKLNKQDATMYFSIDDAQEFVDTISPGITVIDERCFYTDARKKGKLSFPTRMIMWFSDMLSMVKMIHLKIR